MTDSPGATGAAESGERGPSGSPTDCDVGVLCVHGMGQQLQGQAVEAPLRAIADWLRDWLEPRHGKEYGERVAIQSASVAPTQLAPGDPAHALLEVATTSGKTRRWLFCESWWASDFQPPGAVSLCAWMIVHGSGVVVSHLSLALLTRLPSRWLDRAGRSFQIVGAAMDALGASMSKQTPASQERERLDARGLALFWLGLVGVLVVSPFVLLFVVLPTFLLQAATAVLLVLSLVPLRSLRSAIRRILVTLRSVIGDGFQFTANDVVRSSITTHVRKDLAWLAERCKSVVVLAHSQGAAVAFLALTELPPDHPSRAKLQCLRTYGSGLVKLEKIRRDRAPALSIAIAVFTPVYLLAAVPLLGAGSLLSWFLLVAPLPVLLVSALRAADRSIVLSRRLDREFQDALAPAHWRDVRASRDPVPTPVGNGEVIANFGSVLLDHNAYWLNADDFVPRILADIVESDGEIALDLGPKREREARHEARITRLRWLTGARTLLAACAVAGIAFHGDSVRSAGAWLISWAVGSGEAASGSGLLPQVWIDRGLAWARDVPWAPDVLGSVPVLLAAIAWHFLLLFAWRVWSSAESRRWLAPDHGFTYANWLSGVPFALVAVCPLVAAIGGPKTGALLVDALTLISPLGSAIGTILAGAVLIVLGVMLVVVPLLILRRDRQRAGPG